MTRLGAVAVRWRVLAALLLTFACAFVAAWSARSWLGAPLHAFDAAAETLARALGARSAPWWRAITLLGSSRILWPLAFAIGLALYVRGRRGETRLLAQAMVGALLLEQSLKLALHRTRPTALWGDALPNSHSFPSGHALFSATLCLVLAWIAARRRPGGRALAVWALAILVALAVGASRVGLGMHFATDVLGGDAIALLWLAALRRARRPGGVAPPRVPGTAQA